jgi:hypothetical protein
MSSSRSEVRLFLVSVIEDRMLLWLIECSLLSRHGGAVGWMGSADRQTRVAESMAVGRFSKRVGERERALAIRQQ